MNIKLKKIIIALLAISMSIPVFSAPPRPAPRPAPRPVRVVRHHRPPPPPRHHHHRHHCDGVWFAAGGALLAGSIVYASTREPTVIYTAPKTVIVQSEPTIVVQQASPNTIEGLRADLNANLDGKLGSGIPYRVNVESYVYENSLHKAKIAVSVSLNGRNYKITAMGAFSSYVDLRDYLENEIVNAVAKLRSNSSSSTTIIQE